MFTSRIFRRLFIPYLLLIIGVSVVVGLVGRRQLTEAYLDRTEQALAVETRLIARLLHDQLKPSSPAEGWADDLRQYANLTGYRITVIDSAGVVLADTEADPKVMENHASRPEIRQASAAGEGLSRRPSGTVHQDLLYFAHRDIGADGATYYVRAAFHLAQLGDRLRAFYTALSGAGLGATLLAAAVCFWIARRHASPVVELTDFARAVADGDLSRRVLSAERGEFAILAASLNAMANSLSNLVTQTRQDKAELTTIVASISDGMIAVDRQQLLLLANDAAAALLGFDPGDWAGKHLWELVRNEQVLKSAADVLGTGQRATYQVSPLAGKHLELTISPLPAPEEVSRIAEATTSPEQTRIGADAAAQAGTAGTLRRAAHGLVIVAHDTTQSVRYQDLRKEFVANVSHELRTPVSVIKGFVETLLDGAMHDPQRTADYLTRIEKHVDQLTNLVSDLLELSRLESQPGIPEIVEVNPIKLIRRSVELLAPAAEKKGHQLSIDAPDELPSIQGNPDYLERAVSNLIENAIKYTPQNGTIAVAARADGAGVVIEVSDNGLGIPRQDVPRIFERFYRVDRSRSRDMGGTGLGLSIVKHVVQSHGGSIDVETQLGAGSTFRIHLPRQKI